MIDTLDSSLLYKRADGMQGFVHDTMRDFFLARQACKIVMSSDDTAGSVAEIYSSIMGLADPLSSSAWLMGGNLPVELRNSVSFLDEMLPSVLPHLLFDRIMQDQFVMDNLRVAGVYSAGPASKAVVHFNTMTQFNPLIADYLIGVYSHFFNEYSMNLFMTSGSAFELDPRLIDFFPEDKELNEKVLKALMEGHFIGPLEIFLTRTNYGCKCVGIEDLENYKKIRAIEVAKTQGEDFDRNEYIALDQERSVLLANNIMSRLEQYSSDVAFVSHFYLGHLGRLNPYQFLANGVSYILIEPKDEPKFNRDLYNKRFGLFCLKPGEIVDEETTQENIRDLVRNIVKKGVVEQ